MDFVSIDTIAIYAFIADSTNWSQYEPRQDIGAGHILWQSEFGSNAADWPDPGRHHGALRVESCVYATL